MITVGDVLGMQDVLTELTNEADDFDLDGAIVMMETLELLTSQVKTARGALETKVRELLEETKQRRIVGERLYRMKPSGTVRHDHEQIIVETIDLVSVPSEEGEVPTAREAADAAAHIVYDLFVSPRDKAKITRLKHYFGDDTAKAVTFWEKGSDKLEVIDLRAKTEEDA
jgi:hypothetical protein